jgi:hypothetical protein
MLVEAVEISDEWNLSEKARDSPDYEEQDSLINDPNFFDDCEPYKLFESVSEVETNSKLCGFCGLIWNSWNEVVGSRVDDFPEGDDFPESEENLESKDFPIGHSGLLFLNGVGELRGIGHFGIFLYVIKIRDYHTARLYAKVGDTQGRWRCLMFDLSKPFEGKPHISLRP